MRIYQRTAFTVLVRYYILYAGHKSGLKRPGLMLTNHLHLVPSSRMLGAIPQFPSASS